MHIVAVAWIFVVVLMTAAEATSTQGTVLGAFFTLLLYGLLPLAIVLYVMGTPARRQARLKAEAEAEAEVEVETQTAVALAAAAASTTQGDGGGHAAADGRAPKREEP